MYSAVAINQVKHTGILPGIYCLVYMYRRMIVARSIPSISATGPPVIHGHDDMEGLPRLDT